MTFMLSFIGTFIVALVAKTYFGNEISKRETLAQLALGMTIGILVSVLFSYGQLLDYENITGKVVSKHRDNSSYEESYDCNCTTSTDSNGYSTETCQTCWRTIYTVDWFLRSTVGNIGIRSIESESSTVWLTRDPAAYTNAKEGEACTVTRRYTNYILASPESLFNSFEYGDASYDAIVPQYPTVHSIYKMQNAITGDAALPPAQLNAWSDEIRNYMKTRNVNTEPNVIFVFTKAVDLSYRYALERKWLGGKKNDLVVVIGTPNYPAVNWVDVITLGGTTGNELTAVKIRDAIRAADLNVTETTKEVFGIIDRHFDMKPITDFEYLKEEQQITFWQGFFVVLLSTFASAIVSIMFSRNALRSN